MASADEKNPAALQREEKQCLLQLENKTKLAKKDERKMKWTLDTWTVRRALKQDQG